MGYTVVRSGLTPQQAADLLGVSTRTLLRWEDQGKIKPIRTAGGHRRYNVSELLGSQTDASLTVGYARVSSHDQKQDLERQILVLETYCAKQGWNFEIIQDLGSGMNYKKRGLIRLIKLITIHQVERLVFTHKDRLLRFGSDLIFYLCEEFGTEVVIINRSEDSSFDSEAVASLAYGTLRERASEDLTKDVLEIITVFSARLYGSRSHKNKQIVERLREVAEELK